MRLKNHVESLLQIWSLTECTCAPWVEKCVQDIISELENNFYLRYFVTPDVQEFLDSCHHTPVKFNGRLKIGDKIFSRQIFENLNSVLESNVGYASNSRH